VPFAYLLHSPTPYSFQSHELRRDNDNNKQSCDLNGHQNRCLFSAVGMIKQRYRFNASIAGEAKVRIKSHTGICAISKTQTTQAQTYLSCCTHCCFISLVIVHLPVLNVMVILMHKLQKSAFTRPSLHAQVYHIKICKCSLVSYKCCNQVTSNQSD